MPYNPYISTALWCRGNLCCYRLKNAKGPGFNSGTGRFYSEAGALACSSGLGSWHALSQPPNWEVQKSALEVFYLIDPGISTSSYSQYQVPCLLFISHFCCASATVSTTTNNSTLDPDWRCQAATSPLLTCVCIVATWSVSSSCPLLSVSSSLPSTSLLSAEGLDILILVCAADFGYWVGLLLSTAT